MTIEWNEEKARENVRKHGVTFHEAASVFGDPLAMTSADPEHSTTEQRYLTFGVSRFGQRVVVSHADYGDRVRIINARIMTRSEKRIYEEG